MKVLVTGASGFIGKELFRKVKEAGFRVAGIARSLNQTESDILRVDITDRKSLRRLFSRNRFDLVFHLAAHIPKDISRYNTEEFFSCFNVNVLGTINLVEVGAEFGLTRFVYASSASVYGRGVFEVPTCEDKVCPQNFYAGSKLLGEIYLRKLSQRLGFSYAVLRYSSAYGRGMKEKSVLPLFLSEAYGRGVLKVQGSGQRSQDFVYIDDVVEATLKAGLSRESGVYNVGSGYETTMLELAKTIISVVGRGSVRIGSGENDRDETRFFLDIRRASKKLGYLPKFSLRSGLLATISVS